MRLTLPKSRRLRSRREFARVYDHRQRAGDEHLLVFGIRNNLGWTRFGLSVSKKHGDAVRRSRLKRLLREAVRLTQHELPPGLDLVLIPRQDSGATLDDYRRSLVGAARRLARRLPADSPP
ncbi:MAG: ribonuclease P protein component [Planctomycetes bacterium]|nr:ribonuclease P protein component [Planctomycetota bacterium]